VHLAIKPGKRKVLDKKTTVGHPKCQLEEIKASVRAKVERLLPGDQASVRACEAPLSRACEEHGAAEDPVRPVGTVDGLRKPANTGWKSSLGMAGTAKKHKIVAEDDRL
jgi:hypothetical protein